MAGGGPRMVQEETDMSSPESPTAWARRPWKTTSTRPVYENLTPVTP